jgi:hypothetical protein
MNSALSGRNSPQVRMSKFLAGLILLEQFSLRWEEGLE